MEYWSDGLLINPLLQYSIIPITTELDSCTAQ
jgi:hypothetical protein